MIAYIRVEASISAAQADLKTQPQSVIQRKRRQEAKILLVLTFFLNTPTRFEKQVKRKQFTDAQINEILEEAEKGTKLVEICRKFSVSPTSFYRWRESRIKNAPNVGGLEYQRLAEEHSCLKRMYGELALRYNLLSENRRKIS